MDPNQQHMEDIQSVRGMKLGDPTSYLTNALDDLDESQIDPNQLNFPVPQDIKAHLAEKRAEATEVLRQMEKDIGDDGEDSGKTKEPLEEKFKQESEKEKIVSKQDEDKARSPEHMPLKSPSWSDYNSPGHETTANTKELEKMNTIKEEDPNGVKTDIHTSESTTKNPGKKRMAARIYIKKEDSVGTHLKEDKNKGSIILDEHGTNLKNTKETGTGSEEKRKTIQQPKMRYNKEEIKQGKQSHQHYVIKKNLKAGKKDAESIDDYYEDQYDVEPDYEGYEEGNEDYVTEEYLKTSSDLVDAINLEFSNANLYPSDDHTDHIFYLHNSEGMTARDVYFYTMGVSKERSISFAKKTMDMMNKLEGLLALANKNLNHTTTNLKISENNITSLHAYKKDVISDSAKREPTQKWTIKTQSDIDAENAKSNKAERGKGVLEEKIHSTKEEHQIRSRHPGTLTIRDKQEEALKNEANKKLMSRSYVGKNDVEHLAKEKSEKEDSSITEKIVALHMINMSDKLIENDAIMHKLLPMVTDKLVEKIKTGDSKYRAAVLKILVENLKKQIQEENKKN